MSTLAKQFLANNSNISNLGSSSKYLAQHFQNINSGTLDSNNNNYPTTATSAVTSTVPTYNHNNNNSSTRNSNCNLNQKDSTCRLECNYDLDAQQQQLNNYSIYQLNCINFAQQEAQCGYGLSGNQSSGKLSFPLLSVLECSLNFIGSHLVDNKPTKPTKHYYSDNLLTPILTGFVPMTLCQFINQDCVEFLFAYYLLIIGALIQSVGTPTIPIDRHRFHSIRLQSENVTAVIQLRAYSYDTTTMYMRVTIVVLVLARRLC